MKKKLKYSLTGLIIALVVLPTLGILLWQYLPYHSAAATQIKGQLASRGLHVDSLEVVTLSGDYAELANIRLEGGLTVKEMAVNFSVREQALTRVLAKGVALTLYRQGDAWKIGGLENLEKGEAGKLPEIMVEGVTVNVKGVQKEDIILKVPHAETKGDVLVLRSVATGWGGGQISTGEVQVPVALDKPIRVALRFSAVNLGQLLDEAAQGKVKGTGRVSGTLPVVWHPGGKIDLSGGMAKALEAGTLAISPEAIPAGNEGTMAQVRAALANFQYRTLDMKFDSEGDKTIIRLTVEGNSPDAFDGRPVRLNVNLSGDIIPLLQQTVLPIADPRQFLKENK